VQVGGQWLAPEHLRYVWYRMGSDRLGLVHIWAGRRAQANVRPTKSAGDGAHSGPPPFGPPFGPDLTLNVTPIPPPILTPLRCHPKSNCVAVVLWLAEVETV